MTRSPHQRVIATIAYADIFDYPLRMDEVRFWAIGQKVTVSAHIEGLEHAGGYLVFRGRKQIIRNRRRNSAAAVSKWHTARRIARIYRIIPTVLLVGVTGGLAMDNAAPEDDIDLFFVTRNRTIWMTRMAVTLLSELLGLRRRPEEQRVAGKICLNMFMSENSLTLPVTEQDLFAAHEILQMRPLWERDGAYRRFLTANKWVRNYLPVAWKHTTQTRLPARQVPNATWPIIDAVSLVFYVKNVAFGIGYLVLIVIEPLAKAIQLRYMHSRRTGEVIEPGMIRFHPEDARRWIREKYAKRLTPRNIPLDKFFYHR